MSKHVEGCKQRAKRATFRQDFPRLIFQKLLQPEMKNEEREIGRTWKPLNAFSLLPDEYKWSHAWLTTPQRLRVGSLRLRWKLWRPRRRFSCRGRRFGSISQPGNVKRVRRSIQTINLPPLTREMLLFLPPLFSSRLLICFWSGGAAVAPSPMRNANWNWSACQRWPAANHSSPSTKTLRSLNNVPPTPTRVRETTTSKTLKWAQSYFTS